MEEKAFTMAELIAGEHLSWCQKQISSYDDPLLWFRPTTESTISIFEG